jgi:hypothetical protein
MAQKNPHDISYDTMIYDCATIRLVEIARGNILMQTSPKIPNCNTLNVFEIQTHFY